MRKFLVFPFLGLILLVIGGCVSPHPPPITENVSAYGLIEKSEILPEHKIAVDKFSSFNPTFKGVRCRAMQPVEFPEGMTLDEYVRQSFINALSSAGYYSDSAKDSIKGHIVLFENASAMVSDAFIRINIRLTMPNGKQFGVSSNVSWPGKFVGLTACNDMKENIPVAVKKLLVNAFYKPEFRSLLMKRQELSARKKEEERTAKPSPAPLPLNVNKERLVVMQVQGKGISPDEGRIYRNAIVEALSERYEVLSGDDVDAKVNEIFEKESRESIECDTEKCFQDIAIAFQSELIATTTVLKSSGGYMLTVQINNVLDNKAVFTRSRPCEGCNQFAIIGKLREMAGR